MDVPPVTATRPTASGVERLLGVSPPVPVVLLGLLVDGVALSQLVLDPEPGLVQFFEVSIPIVLTLLGFYGAHHVYRSDRAADVQPRILLVAGTFMLIASVTVGIIAWMRIVEENSVGDAQFTFTMALAAGYGVGAVFGIYYDEALRNRTQLAEQAETTRKLNERLQVLLRMLRHNVRNEIQIINGVLEQLRRRTTEPETVEQLEQIEESAKRLHSHSERALSIRELDPDAEPGVTDMVAVINRYLARLDPEVRDDVIEVDLPEHAYVRAKQIIDVAVVESVRNALEHNDMESLTVRIEVTAEEDWVEVVIADTGSGVPSSERTALTADAESPLDHGSGVGLWLIRWVVDDSNGEVSFESDEEADGFTVRMRLPRAMR